MTLNKIAPKTASTEAAELWDMTAVAALVRILAENYLLLVWLCVETEEQVLWEFRITALTIMDNRARYRLTAEVEGQAEPEDFVAAQRALGDRIAATPMFQRLGSKRQRELLKGDKLPFVQDEVVDRLNLDPATFRKFYRYLSSFVHTGTVSFFRMEKQNRGRGEYNEYEAGAMRAALEFAALIIRRTIADVKRVIVEFD